MNTISIITPTLGNRPDMLAEAIASVSAQTIKPIEHIIEYDHGDGQAKTLNRAMRKVTGDLFIFLADDDKLDPYFIEKTLREMERSGVHIVGTWLENFGGDTGTHGPSNFPFGTALAMTSLWKEIGFDEEVGVTVDADFWLCCKKRGYRWSFISEPLFKSRVHEGQYTHRADWEFSRKAMKAKHKEQYV